jgi:molybdate transport system ATP-binding protein
MSSSSRNPLLVVDIAVERSSARGECFSLEAEFAAGGGVTVVCGASGAGKSTLLLALVGALRPASGRIALDGAILYDSQGAIDLPTRKRRIGMVFQDAPLFPHLDATGNVAFGMSGSDRDTRALRLLERTGADRLARRMPSELSGGERQRIALARALAAEPAALLLDEPFSAIDLPSRASLADLLVELQATAGIPFVHVTHDLSEALRLGTRMVLLDRGRVAQIGTPAEVLARPASVAAARAVGTENLFSATVRRHLVEQGCTEVDLDGTLVQIVSSDLPVESRLVLGLRAEEILLSLRPLHETSARNVIEGRIESIVERDRGIEVHVTTPTLFRAMVTPAAVRELALEDGKQVWLLIKATAFQRLD